MKLLIAYGTTEGQTKIIAAQLAEVLAEHGAEVEVVDLKGAGQVGLVGYDGVVVGASIHVGKHPDYVVDFVRRHLPELQRLPSAMFSVSLAAHGDRENAERYVEEFEEQTGWRPAAVALVAGALRYTEYGFVKRHLMKKIAKDKPGNLGQDTSRDYIYTDWDEVRRFAEDFLEQATSRARRQRTSATSPETGG